MSNNIPCNDEKIEPKYFPLEYLLKLYAAHSNGPNCLYLNYFADFKLLIKFLGPFSYKQPKRIRSIPWFAGSYELQEIARHLGLEQRILYSILYEMYEGED